MKRRELLWMLVPCLLLAIAGLWMRASEKAAVQVVVAAPDESGPFQLFVKSIEKIPVTPHDVADGHDIKVRVRIGRKGKKPPLWGESGFGTFFCDAKVLMQRNGQPVRLMDNIDKSFQDKGVATVINGYQSEHDAYQFCFLTKLSDAPPDYGALQFKMDLVWRMSPGTHFSFVRRETVASMLKNGALPRASGHIILRYAGQNTPLPQVSRDSQIEVRKIVVRPLTAQEKTSWMGMDTLVEFHLFYRGPLNTKEDTLGVGPAGQVSLKSERGEEHRIGNVVVTSAKRDKNTLRHFVVPYYLNLKPIPLSEGRITFSADLAVADGWPLPISVVVREPKRKP